VALVDEWVEKAEADYKGAVALNRRRTAPLPDLVCYHCHQCTEKYLKAYLLHHGIAPPRVHNLVQLMNLCAVQDSTLTSRLPLARSLNAYGVLIRYPGISATPVEAAGALRTTRRLRTLLRHRLGL
jgi:HEPN domain-containing protein